MKAHLKWIASGLLAFAANGTVQAESVAAPKASDFARKPLFDQQSLSPDGKHLAASVRDGEGKHSMLVLALPGKKPTYALRFVGDEAVAAFHWVSNQRLIVSLGRQETATDVPRLTGELFAVDVDGKQATYLFGYQGRGTTGTRLRRGNEEVQGAAFFVSDIEADPKEALVSMSTDITGVHQSRYFTGDYANLYRIDVYTGKRTEVAKSPVRRPIQYFADAKGVPRLMTGIGEDSPDTLIFWRRPTGPWLPLSLPGKGATALSLHRDGSRAYLAIEPKPEQRCLVEVTLSATSEPQQKNLLCKSPEEVRSFVFDRDEVPYGYRDSRRSPTQLIRDAPLEGQILLSLEQQFPDQIVSLVSSSRDGRKLLYFVYSDRNSGEYYLYDDDSKEAEFFNATRLWLDPEAMSPQQSHRYKARDGLEIDALLTVPRGKVAKNLPMVVMPHGGPIGVSDRWGFDQDAQYLASLGYAVLQVNFRGSAGRGEAFEKLGYGEWAGKMIDDITDGTHWAVAQGYADAKRVCIFGASYGGYAALMSAVREPDLYRCAVGYAGVYDLNLLLADSDVAEYRSGRLFWSESIADTPAKRAIQSPLAQIDRLKAAVMIVHGEDDTRTPINQAKALRSALEKRDIPYEWLVKRGEGHGFFNEKNIVELYGKLAGFLEKHIGK